MKNYLIILTLVFISLNIFADMDDIRKFKKCYALFTSRSLTPEHVVMSQVIAGTVSGENACKQLIQKANLQADNRIQGGSSNREAQRVLRNFQYLHRSFFEMDDYKSRGDVNDTSYTENLFDINSDAYFWTYAMFKPGAGVSTIVTNDHTYVSIRSSTNPDRKNRDLGGTIRDLSSGWKNNPTPVDKGLLEGIKRDDRVFTYGIDDTRHFKEFAGMNGNKHHGGGVIGSQVYLFGNLGIHGILQRQNGGQQTRRRWARQVVKDLLCREMPALRFSDVLSDVKPASAFPYRHGAMCMQCHSTMDPMSGNARNIITNGRFGEAMSPFAAFAVPVSEPSVSTIIPELSNDNDFYKRPPIGRLMYRSYNGDLINVATNNLSELGSAIANTNDFYVCAAKKYYKFLTGIEVNLYDLEDPSSPVVLSSLETQHRNRVIQIGLGLKQHQDIQQMINEIIQTKTFIYPEVFE